MKKLTPADSKSGVWRVLRYATLALLVAWYGALLWYQPLLPAADDMARHVTNGELLLNGQWEVLYANVYSYTDPGHPFVNHHWLSGVVYHLVLMVSGWEGLVLLKVFTYIAAFLLVFAAARRFADFWTVAGLSLPAILILIERTSLRPEMFSYLFIAISLYLLTDLYKYPGKRHVYWLIPLQLLWVNMHIFFSIGIMMVGAFFGSAVLMRLTSFWKDPLVRKMAVVCVGVIAISFVNPHGAAGVVYRYPDEFPVQISENQTLAEFKEVSTSVTDIAATVYTPLVVVAGLSLLYGLYRRRVPLFILFGTVATAMLGFFIMRGIYFFGFFFLLSMAMVWSPVLLRARAYLQKRLPEAAVWVGVLAAGLVIAALIYGLTPDVQKRLSPQAFRGIGLAPRSLDAGNFLTDNSIRGPIFNDPDIGSYLIYTLYPKERVFVDNLFADAYSAETFKEYVGMLESEVAWRAGLIRYQFNAIVFYPYDGGDYVRKFLYDRLNDPEWAFVYGDSFAMVFVRRTPENQPIIDRFLITPENVAYRLATLKSADDFDGKVAFADIANLMGRSDLGMETFLEILRTWPENGKMWSVTAQWELVRNGPDSARLALAYLEKALSLGHDGAETYSFLGLAYTRLNDLPRAREALEKALSINPERQDAKNLLGQITQYEETGVWE